VIKDLTDDEARRAIVLKWGTVDPDVLPAWVAEMDYALAPPIREALLDAVNTGVTGYPVFGPGGRLYERESELRRAEAELDAAVTGSGRLLFIEGRAGIGKSRLLSEVSRIAEQRGFAVYRASGVELESEFAYGVVRQLFEFHAHRLAPGERAVLFRGAAALAEPVLLASGRSEPESDPPDEAPGDRVYAAELGNTKGGFYAEYAVVKADNASVIPGTLNMDQAAVLPSDGLTALKGLEDVLGLQPDESVMIFGASGGIGHLAVQLAKRLGARVFAVASGEDGVSFVKRLGADAAVDGRSDNVLDVAREFAPDGIDAALVTAGGEATDRALSAIRPGGRIAHQNGVMPVPKAPARVSIDAYDGEGGREAIDRLNQLIEAGPFEVHVHRTFPLEQAAEAQAALEEHHLGKIALRVG